MNIFLANVGNRDIGINLGYAESPLYYYFNKDVSYFSEENSHWNDLQEMLKLSEKGTRHAAAKMNEDFENHKDRLIAPIIFSALKQVLTEYEKIERLILFVSNNPELSQHWKWDTIEAGNLLEKLVRSDAELAGKIKTIEIVEVQNPNLHDSAYEFIGRKLAEFPEQKVKKVFASLSGGIPAMNSALRAQAVERYGTKTILMQMQEPTEAEKVRGVSGELKFLNSWGFRRTLIFRLVRTLLERYDYRGAEIILEREKVKGEIGEALCRHAHLRFNFDFAGAVEALGGITDVSVNQIRESAADFSKTQRIAEIVWTSEVLLKRGDYVGFVTRIALLCEFTRQYLVQLLTDLELDEFSRRTMIQIIEKALKKTDKTKKDSVKETLDSIKLLEGLEILRNQCLHRGKKVSLSDINGKFADCRKELPQLRASLVKSLTNLESSSGKNGKFREPKTIYREINKRIIQELENL